MEQSALTTKFNFKQKVINMAKKLKEKALAKGMVFHQKKHRWYGDLALYFAECATDFTMGYGDIDEDFYDALGDAYHDAVVIASKEEQLYK